VTQLRTKEVGRNTVVPATGLRDSSMLTQDENIVDIRFTVQVPLKDARAFLFENREPEEAVGAGRRIGGARDRRQVEHGLRCCTSSATRSPTDLVKSVQAQLDR
jgi:membrane protease subunit HflK